MTEAPTTTRERWSAPYPVEEWAPLFTRLRELTPERLTAENTQGRFADGSTYCQLCGMRYLGGDREHAPRHRRELRDWLARSRRERERDKARHLREIAALRRETERALDRASTAAGGATVNGRTGSPRDHDDEGGTIMADTATKEKGSTTTRGKRGASAPAKPADGATEATTTARKSSVPDEIRKRIVAEINGGDGKAPRGLSSVAKGLNDDGVPTPGKATSWTPQYVRSIYLRETGAKGVKEQRAKAPLQRKAEKAAASA